MKQCKRFLLLTLLAFVAALGLDAQTAQRVSGAVVDAQGLPLPGVQVIPVGATASGTVTDGDGKYTVNVPKGITTLEFTFIGMTTERVVIGGRKEINVTLHDEVTMLEGVVVTALGIKRAEKALSYNVQQIKNDALTAVKDISFVNNLNGRVAGVNINSSAAGVGGASRVVMRGAKSITGGNNVLYVIDGVPMFNKSGGDVGGGRYSGQPSGEGISDINPDDIESVNVLTGPSAAALYGSAASNGVILINTKRGKEGKVSVAFSSSMDFSSPMMMPRFQNTYGNEDGSFQSWGAKLATPSTFRPRDFFQTGHNITNSVTLTTGTEKNQTYLSAASTNAQGIMPNNEYDRYNFTVRNTAKFADDKLTLDLSGSYIMQSNQNMYRSGEYYNPLPALYLFPRGESWEAVRLYKRYDATRRFPVQYWPYGDNGMQMQNPYFIVNDIMMPSKRKRYMLMGSLKWDILDWMNVTGRVRVDNTDTESEGRLHASGRGMLYARTLGNGIYNHSQGQDTQTYIDGMLNIDRKLSDDFALTANIGASIEDYRSSTVGFGGPILQVPNVFSSDALDPTQNRGSDSHFRKRSTALFASAELSWKGMLYLTMTGRNDWSSLLVNAKEPSFFYPSIGLSGIISSMVDLPEAISFLKVRGSYTEVGSPIPDRYRGVTRGTITYGLNNGVPVARTIMPFYDFKAERTRSYELGVNLRLFKKLNFDFTWYQSDTYNQTFFRGLPASSPYSGFYIQAGRIQNRGLEMALNYDDSFGDVDLSTGLVFSRNVNKIKQLVRDYPMGDGSGDVVSFSEGNVDGHYMREGDAIGDVYTDRIIRRDQMGNIAVDDDGRISSMYLPNGYQLKLGSSTPDFTLGWRNEIRWKGLSLSFLINARVGGIVTSATQAVMDQFGVSQASADARDAGGIVLPDGTGRVIAAQDYYSVVAGEQLLAYYYYSATNVRLQEATLTYTLPERIAGLKLPKMALSLIGRNLWMIYNKAPFDPELTATTGTYGVGGDYFNAPSLRNLGFSLKVNI